MRVRDSQVAAGALTGRQPVTYPFTITQSKTNRPYVLARPGKPWEFLTGAASLVAYTATVGVRFAKCPKTEAIVSGAALAIHSTPEQFAVGAHVVRAAGKFVEKAATGALTFTAAHVITASKYGIILVQEDSAGAISTKVPASPQAYNDAATALAALPAADANKVAIGYIAIANNAGDWTGNTDDLTDASDVTTATFVSNAATIKFCDTGSTAPVAFEVKEATRSATATDYQDLTGTFDLIALITTDGNAVVTNAALHATYRGIGTQTA